MLVSAVYPACAGIDPLVAQVDAGVCGLPRMRGDRPRLEQGCTGTTTFTPHARGSTRARRVAVMADVVYPACAGIDRYLKKCAHGCLSLPRMRGDRPLLTIGQSCHALFTPHARGSTVSRLLSQARREVYPACAGIDLCEASYAFTCDRLPRMRGDRPRPRFIGCIGIQFTPHARGSTRPSFTGKGTDAVYPACAGIDPSAQKSDSILISLPRMRGDRPLLLAAGCEEVRFTPHARGSTRSSALFFDLYTVYPACAGIDPPKSLTMRQLLSLPRMRGDRPGTGPNNS